MQTNLLLDIAAEACGDRIAIGSKTAGLSYAVLRTRARAVGAWLASADTQHAVFVGLNGDALPVLLFGSGLAGLPFVPINYRLSDEDLRKLVARTVPADADLVWASPWREGPDHCETLRQQLQ